jgi:hypothetical protein
MLGWSAGGSAGEVCVVVMWVGLAKQQMRCREVTRVACVSGQPSYGC